MGRKRGEYYIDPADLEKEIRKYKETGIQSEKLGKFLIKLANRFASRPNFSGYSYKDEFISDAIYRMVDQMDKIDLDHPQCNPFAYLTQTCYNVFIARINKEKKYTATKNALKDYYFNELEETENITFKRNPEDDGE